MPTRRRFLQAATLAAGSLPHAGHAEAYPSRPVRVVVPYPPGGSTDTTARVVGERLTARFGQPFLVDNRPGAGGNLGMELAARAKPDGHTLAVATTAHAINATLFPRLAYDTLKDFAPVALLTESPLILVVNPALPAATVPELIALAKRKPGDLRYASSGNGQSTHLAAELFCAMAGVKMIHVPYRGSAPALQDVVGGQVELMVDASQSALPHVGKTVRALGVTATARLPVLPDTPTIAETLPGYEAIAWNGLVAPVGTPSGIVDRLNAAVLDVLAEPGVTGRFEALGATCRPTTPARFGAYVAAEIAKWSKVVHESGAKVD